VLLAVDRAAQFTIGLIADPRDPLLRLDERPVPHDVAAHAAAHSRREAAWRVLHGPVHPYRLAGSNRVLEHVLAMSQLVVEVAERRNPERDLPRLHLG
jgi:hypothetical protein